MPELPTDPDGANWKDDGPRKVTPWKYLGTREVCDGEQVRFRARLCRYETADGYSIEPEVQFCWKGQWSTGFNTRSFQRARAMATSSISAAKAALV
jgi:hypothetical protein